MIYVSMFQLMKNYKEHDAILYRKSRAIRKVANQKFTKLQFYIFPAIFYIHSKYIRKDNGRSSSKDRALSSEPKFGGSVLSQNTSSLQKTLQHIKMNYSI